MELCNKVTFWHRYNSLQFKLFLGNLNSDNYDRESLKYFFFMYLCSYIIPKYLNIKTPSQILYKNTFVTLLRYEDIEFMLNPKSLNLLKRKRIIRFMEEANEQGKRLSYKDIALLSYSTKTTVSKWINDTRLLLELSSPITKNSSIYLRKTAIVKLFIEDKLLSKYELEDKQETNKKNYGALYVTNSEIYWYFSEFLLVCLNYINGNIIVADICSRLRINDKQYKQYVGLYNINKDFINKKYDDYLINAMKIIDPIELISYTIENVGELGTKEEINAVICNGITYLKNSTNITDDYSVQMSLKGNQVNKHCNNKKEDIYKIVELKIYSDNAIANYDGIRNSEFIRETISMLKKCAEDNDTNITAIDLSFVLGVSRDFIQKFK